MSHWVECQICPKQCRIAPGRSGDCRIRVNVDGKLVATTYGFPTTMHIDPMEKKPLYHFLPGSDILSVATVGCNLHCQGCQNHSISQANPEEMEAWEFPPERLVELAIERGSPSIAYTYTEPIASYEYTLDCCSAARSKGIRNVLVTAAYINEAPLRKLCPYVDAANVDIKSFSEEFYRKMCSASLAPVLRATQVMVEMGVWVEITYLVIPEMNDSPEEINAMLAWVKQNLGTEIPIHFSRFHPQYRMKNVPPTPAETMEMCRTTALEMGFPFVYLGNLRRPGGEDTLCPNKECPERTTPLIARAGFRILSNRLVAGKCPACGAAVAGVWS